MEVVGGVLRDNFLDGKVENEGKKGMTILLESVVHCHGKTL